MEGELGEFAARGWGCEEGEEEDDVWAPQGSSGRRLRPSRWSQSWFCKHTHTYDGTVRCVLVLIALCIRATMKFIFATFRTWMAVNLSFNGEEQKLVVLPRTSVHFQISDGRNN